MKGFTHELGTPFLPSMRRSLKMVWTQGPFRLYCLISERGVHSMLSVTTQGEVPSWVAGCDPHMLGVPSTCLLCLSPMVAPYLRVTHPQRKPEFPPVCTKRSQSQEAKWAIAFWPCSFCLLTEGNWSFIKCLSLGWGALPVQIIRASSSVSRPLLLLHQSLALADPQISGLN